MPPNGWFTPGGQTSETPPRDEREAERSARAVLDSLAASIAILDESGTILSVNRAWRDFASANAPPGAPVFEGSNYLRVCDQATGTSAQTAHDFAAGIRDVLAGHSEEFAQEYPCHAPGQERWFVGRVTRLASDGPPRAVVTHENVTHRKRMEGELAQSEARLQTVLDHVQAAIFLKDLEGRYLLVNRRFADQFGVTQNGVIGQTDFDFLPAEVAEIFRENDRKAMAEGKPVEAEEVVPHDDGPQTSIVIRVPVTSPEGKPFAVCGIATNITVRKRSEDARREMESTLRSFYDGAPVALAVAEVTDGDFRIISANATLARLLGCSLEELPWRQAGELDILEQHRMRWFIAYQEARQNGQPARFEHVWDLPDGPGWFSVIILPIANESSGCPRFCLVIEDITGNKKSEREIFELNAELEARLERISTLREIDLAISSSLDLPLTLGIVIDRVVGQLEVDSAGILLRSPQMPALEYAIRKGYRIEATSGRSQRLDEGPAGRAVLECRTQHFPGPLGMAETPPEWFQAEGFVSYFAVPLAVKGQVKGVLEVGLRSPLDPEPEWLEYLEALARQAAIAVDNAQLFEGLRRSNLELSLAYDATIEGWSRAMDLRDHETEGHSRRVTEMTLRLARMMGIDNSEMVHIRRGALLHDIGKIGIPDSILLKAGPLIGEEIQIMQRHPEYAMGMLSPIAFLRPALDIPYCHHEKWDGTGYPRGLKTEQIPLSARIFSAVDIWDALSSDRPYRMRWPCEKVHEHLRSLAKTHLDPNVVEVFLQILTAEKGA